MGGYKRSRNSREKVRDAERYARKRNICASLPLEKICNFQDDDCCIFIMTVNGVGAGTLHIIILEDLNILNVSTKYGPSVLSDEQKERTFVDRDGHQYRRSPSL